MLLILWITTFSSGLRVNILLFFFNTAMKIIEINTNIDTNIDTNNFIINSRINKPISQNYFYIHGVANIPSVLLLLLQEKIFFCKNRDTFEHNNIFNNIFE